MPSNALNDLSLLSIKPYEHYYVNNMATSATPATTTTVTTTPMSMEKPVNESLQMECSIRDCLEKLAEAATSLRNEMDGVGYGNADPSSTSSSLSVQSRSPTVAACRGSLAWEFAAMMSEAHVLMDSLGMEGVMVTPWRVSLLQARIHSYLSMIEKLMQGVDREKLDTELLRILAPVLASISDENQKQQDRDAEGCADNVTKPSNDLPVRISSWRTPSLAFDVQLSAPLRYTHKASPPCHKGEFSNQLPLRAEVKAMTDFMAKEIETGMVPTCKPCTLELERCRHEATDSTNNLGIVAEAMLRLRLSPEALVAQRASTMGHAAADKDGVNNDNVAGERLWQSDDNVVTVEEARV